MYGEEHPICQGWTLGKGTWSPHGYWQGKRAPPESEYQPGKYVDVTGQAWPVDEHLKPEAGSDRGHCILEDE